MVFVVTLSTMAAAMLAPWWGMGAAVGASPIDTESVPETIADTVPVPTLGEPPVDMGSVEIITPQGEPLSSGGSSTLYSLRLPDDAACPSDTASNNWLVQSFLIPIDDDPGAISYSIVGPQGTQFPLFAFDTRPFVHQFTQVSSTTDGPGVISTLPALTFSVFEPGFVPAGRYRIGVACTFWRDTARYWDTEIVIEAQPDDTPAQLTWRAPEAAPFVPPRDSSTRRTLLIGGIVAALVAAAVLLWQSRSDSPQPSSRRLSKGVGSATTSSTSSDRPPDSKDS